MTTEQINGKKYTVISVEDQGDWQRWFCEDSKGNQVRFIKDSDGFTREKSTTRKNYNRYTNVAGMSRKGW